VRVIPQMSPARPRARNLGRVARLAVLVGLAVVAAWAISAPAASADVPAGARCPVMTDKAANPEYSLVYQGRRIEFCCQSCVDAFKANPRKYLANLPPAPAAPPADPSGRRADARAAPVEQAPPLVRQLEHLRRELIRLHGPALLVGLMLLLLHERVRQRRARVLPTPAGLQLLVRPPVVILALALAELVPQIWHLRQQAQVSQASQVSDAEAAVLRHKASEYDRVKLLDYIHYATFYDYGMPPRPWRMAGPKKLAASYYRGNDERDQRLFNGGNYLTATFRVSLRTDDGAEAVAGQQLAGRRPGLRVEITRAPNTPDFFWTPDRMSLAYLTMQNDPFMGSRAPVPDRVALTEIEPRQRWEAIYPLPVPARGPARLRGIIYLCEEQQEDGKMIGGRFHYGIEVDLHLQDGKLLEASDLWMNSTYRGRKFARFQIADEEWFSDRLLPAKLAPGTSDPNALGVDEYKPPGAL
jgi:YHS domain-containing protein